MVSMTEGSVHVSVRALAGVALLLMVGCAATIAPAVNDTHLTLRVQTALINDPEIGTLPIEVRAANGLVALTGRVRSESDRERAVRVARGVDGVRDVRATLRIADIPPDEVPRPPPEPPEPRDEPRDGLWRLIGLGFSVTGTRPEPARLGDGLSVGPLLRLPNRRGLGPTIGFSWTELEIDAGPEGLPGLAHLRMRPVMIGLEYGQPVGRLALSASLVGGWSFNSVRVDRNAAGPLRAIEAESGFAWRPGASLWYDVTARMGVNLFVGGLFANPRVTFASDEELRTMRLRTNAAIVSVGLAWWLF
ncbi:MAG: BON domain-containing protein [Luteitalea sp.]|nr:BON domain-containing protein [Luteitalea sp.]